jgi:Phenazine biosynthesis-like protein
MNKAMPALDHRSDDGYLNKNLTGTPLAIFTDTRGLRDRQMQALAREMNLPETTFILPREPRIEAEKRDPGPHFHARRASGEEPVLYRYSAVRNGGCPANGNSPAARQTDDAHVTRSL